LARSEDFACKFNLLKKETGRKFSVIFLKEEIEEKKKKKLKANVDFLLEILGYLYF